MELADLADGRVDVGHAPNHPSMREVICHFHCFFMRSWSDPIRQMTVGRTLTGTGTTLARGPAAVHSQGFPVDKRGVIRQEERYGGRDIVGFAYGPER